MDGKYKLQINFYNHNGEYGANVVIYDINGSSPAVDAYATARQFQQDWVTNCGPLLRACLGNTTILDYTRCRKFDLPSGPFSQYNENLGGLGALAGSTFGQSTDIRLKPGGRKNRSGHFFVCGITSGSYQGGRLVPAALTAVTAFAGTLITPITLTGGGTCKMQTWTRARLPPKPNPYPEAFTNVTDFEIATKATGLNKRTLPLI